MRYILLVVLLPLLAACSTTAGQKEPSSQAEINTEVNIESDPTQAVNPTLIPNQEPDSEPTSQVELPNLGPAPELTNEVWLNTAQPLRLDDLKGVVVLLEMWTFG
jgi:hypothetical protein